MALNATAERRLHLAAQLREIDRWKQRAKASPDGRCYIGAGCYVVYLAPKTADTDKPVSASQPKN